MTVKRVNKPLGFAIIFSLALSLAGIGCVKSSVKADQHQDTVVSLKGTDLNSYIETYAEVVYRNYQDSRQEAERMAEAIAAFLDQPNKSTQDAAKQAWIKARQSYLQTEAFRFYEGPIDFINSETGEEGPEGRINAWPMNEAFIDYVRDKATAIRSEDISKALRVAKEVKILLRVSSGSPWRNSAR